MKLIALQEFPYAGKALKPGDEFDSASNEDARILKGVGKARDAEKHVETRALKAEDQPLFAPEQTSETQPKQRRRYNRRDLQAED